MCGIAGICLARVGTAALPELLEASLLLQHRGQDACGIATHDRHGKPRVQKDFGLVTEVFGEAEAGLQRLSGSMGIAHVRYRTAGRSTLAEVQPLQNPARPEVMLCHNGNLVNRDQLHNSLGAGPWPAAVDAGDSALILHVLVSNLHHSEIDVLSLVVALEAVYRRCKGAFACVVQVSKDLMVGFRDPHGLKPLLLGERHHQNGSVDYMFASESVALDKLGFSNMRNVMPGEAIVISRFGKAPLRPYVRQIVPRLSYTPDIFEYVYFARPDSMLDGLCVQSARQNMGRALSRTIAKQPFAIDVDVVIPVPETSYISTLTAAQSLDKQFTFGLVKNRYIGRTFIMPSQDQRRKGVARKLNAVRSEFEGRHVLLVDDSIVRGTTSKAIVQMAYAAGARKVTFASCSPAIRYKHVHCIELADTAELIAHSRSHDPTRQALGCDNLVYLPLEELMKSCMQSRIDGSVQGFEVGVFSGSYVTDGWNGKCVAAHGIGWHDRDVGLSKPGNVTYYGPQHGAHTAISLKT